jgi:hypothetical protein
LDQTIVVRGNIERFTLGPQGETIGAVLDSDSEMVLRWPGTLQERFLGIMNLGDRVRATGRRVMGPTGDNMILVKSVTNLDSRESAEDPGYVESPARPPRATPIGEGRRDIDIERRLRNLEDQIAELRHAIDQLRSQK